MNSNNNYTFDVFLSWTGHNRGEKNIVSNYLKEKGLIVYDSDVECNGYFIDSCLDSLALSKVYVLFLSKSLDNDEYFSYVMDEFSKFNQLAHQKKINIIILDLDSYFSEDHPESDVVHWFNNRKENYETSHIRMYGDSSFEKLFSEKKEIILKHINEFIEAREKGKPIYYRELDNGIKYNCDFSNDNIIDREEVLNKITSAFSSGKKNVILYGPGGIGKTSIVNKYVKEHKNDYIQTIFVSSDTLRSSDSKVEMVLSNVDFMNSELEKMARLPSKNQQLNYQKEILGRLPREQFIIIDNIDNLNCDDVEAISRLFPCRLLFTTRSTIDFSDFEEIKIESMDEEHAKEVFINTSKKEISSEKFHRLFEAYNGNTMILSMIATLYKSHDDYSVEESLFAFSHNEFASTGTLEDQLKVIFSSAYNKENIDINQVLLILNMSLLSDYVISLSDLYENIKHLNKYEIDNAILLLEKNGGWIDREGDKVYIDRNISNCISDILLEKFFDNDKTKMSDECSRLDLTDYILNKSYNVKLYTDVLREQNNLLYALKNYAKITGIINEQLFNRYTQLCEELKIEDYIIKQLESLQSLLTDKKNIAKVVTYKALMQLRLDPLSDKWFEEFANNLIYCSNYEHKWIIKIFSISSQYFKYYDIRKSKMVKCLDNAWKVLYEEVETSKDNNTKEYYETLISEIMIFYVNYLISESFVGTRKVVKYAKRINRKHNTDNYLLLKLFEIDAPIFKKPEKFQSMASNPSSFAAKHLLMSIRSYLLSRKIDKRVGTTPLFKSLQKLIDGVFDDDVLKLIEGTYQISQYFINNDLTLVPTGDAINGVISLTYNYLESGLSKVDLINTYSDITKKLDFLRSEQSNLTDLSILQIEQKIAYYANKPDAIDKALLIFKTKGQYLDSSHPIMIDSLIDYLSSVSYNSLDQNMFKILVDVSLQNNNRYREDELLLNIVNCLSDVDIDSYQSLFDMIDSLEESSIKNYLKIATLEYIYRRFRGKKLTINKQSNNDDEVIEKVLWFSNFIDNLKDNTLNIINNTNFKLINKYYRKKVMASLMRLTGIYIIGSYDYDIDILKAVKKGIKQLNFGIFNRDVVNKKIVLMHLNTEIYAIKSKNKVAINKKYVKEMKYLIKNRLNDLSVIINNWTKSFSHIDDFLAMNKLQDKYSMVERFVLHNILRPSNVSTMYEFCNYEDDHVDMRLRKKEYSRKPVAYLETLLHQMLEKMVINDLVDNNVLKNEFLNQASRIMMVNDLQSFLNNCESSFVKIVSSKINTLAFIVFNCSYEEFIKESKKKENKNSICQLLAESKGLFFNENEKIVKYDYALTYVLINNVNIIDDDFNKSVRFAETNKWRIITQGIIADCLSLVHLRKDFTELQVKEQIKTNIPFVYDKYEERLSSSEATISLEIRKEVFNDVIDYFNKCIQNNLITYCTASDFGSEEKIANSYLRGIVAKNIFKKLNDIYNENIEEKDKE